MIRCCGFGFTLIELLIAVAIIAILAGIVIPNLLEAQTRSKVSRVKAELRTIALALEFYHSDKNIYPCSTLIPRFMRLRPLTTPIAYMTTVPRDVFQSQSASRHPWLWPGVYAYGAMPIDEESRWALASNGPDLNSDSRLIEFYPGYSEGIWENPETGFNYVRYDPSNGPITNGDIWSVSDYQM